MVILGDSQKLISQSQVDVITPNKAPGRPGVYFAKGGQHGKIIGYKLMRVIDIPQLYLSQHINAECKTPMGLWQYLQSLDASMSRDEVMCVVFFE